MRRFLRTTRGRLVTFTVAILGVALLLADGGVLGSLAITQTNESNAVLVSQANMIAAGTKGTKRPLSLCSGELPGETQGGIAVDAAIVSPSGTVTQTAARPLAQSVLNDLAARAERSRKPVWADVTDLRGSPRRVYAIPLTVSADSLAALVVSRSVREQQASLTRTVLLIAPFSAAVLLVGGLLAHWLAGRVLRPVRVIANPPRPLSQRELNRRVDGRVPDDGPGRPRGTLNR